MKAEIRTITLIRRKVRGYFQRTEFIKMIEQEEWKYFLITTKAQVVGNNDRGLTLWVPWYGILISKINLREVHMPKNKIQFQQVLSLSKFLNQVI